MEISKIKHYKIDCCHFCPCKIPHLNRCDKTDPIKEKMGVLFPHQHKRGRGLKGSTKGVHSPGQSSKYRGSFAPEDFCSAVFTPAEF